MLNPWMLLGLLGLAIPPIIHLIQRQRLKPQPLATLQFLDKEDVANAFAPVPRDLLQLLLRLLLMALFILLMARLTLRSPEPGPRSLAVILDHSMSMQQTVDGERLFDRSVRQIGELVDSLGEDDRLAIYLVGDRVALETGFLQDKAELRRIVAGLTVSDGGGLALAPTIRQAVNQLRSRREVNPCVIVFTDGQRSNFTAALAEDGGPEVADAAVFRRALADSDVKLLFVNERAVQTPNVAVLDAAFAPERVHLGAGARLTATVRNDTDEAREVAVQFGEGQGEAQTSGEARQVPVAAGETVQVDLVHRFESPVDTACSVAIDDDALAGDNRFWLPMRMKGRQQILFVLGGEQAVESEAAGDLAMGGSDLLGYALNPGEATGLGGDTYVSSRRIAESYLTTVSLPMYSIVVLYGVESLSEQSARDLSQFVASGGGLWIVCDGELSPQRFNESCAPLLGGVTIGQEKTPDPVPGLHRLEASLGHPLLAPLLREAWGGLDDLHVSRYYGLLSEGSAKTMLRADNGDPLLVAVEHGQGRIVVQLFAPDFASGSLPRSTVFVPLVQELVGWLGKEDERVPVDTLRVGQSLALATPEFRGLTGDVTLSGPVAQDFPLGGEAADTVHVTGLLQAGAYEVAHAAKQTGRKRWLTVNPVAGESALAPLSDEELTALYGEGQARRLAWAEVGEQFARRREATPLLLVLVLAALLAESLAGAWQSRAGRRGGGR